MRSTPYNFSGTSPEDTAEHTEETEKPAASIETPNPPQAKPPVTIVKTNWPLTIFLVFLAAVVVYFIMKRKMPVAV